MEEEENEQPGKFEQWLSRHVSDEKLMSIMLTFSVLMGVGLSLLLFIFLPSFIVGIVNQVVPGGISLWVMGVLEGFLKGFIFVLYLFLCSWMKDIHRVFCYHGAEHKTINAFEAGAELTPESVSQYSRIHTRCGTSFILMAMILMIIIFTFVGQTAALYRILIKIVLLPLIAGLAYELFRLPLKFPNSKVVKALVAPGLAMQRLTTREPDLEQVEVAIAALQAVPEFGVDPATETEEADSQPTDTPAEAIKEELLPVDENTMVFPTKNPDTEHA